MWRGSRVQSDDQPASCLRLREAVSISLDDIVILQLEFQPVLPKGMWLPVTIPFKSEVPNFRAIALAFRALPAGIDIIVTDDIVLAQIGARLHLDQDHRQFSGVLHPVLCA
jgi:hypothetical protein